jgi:hypothetical protein
LDFKPAQKKAAILRFVVSFCSEPQNLFYAVLQAFVASQACSDKLNIRNDKRKFRRRRRQMERSGRPMCPQSSFLTFFPIINFQL